MGRLHPRNVLRFAWRLVVTVVALAYLLAVRSALWVFTMVLMVYFAVNDPALSMSCLDLVNRAIPGEISAARIHWEPFSSRVHVLDVVITRPGDVPVIQAARVSTDMRIGSLLAYLIIGSDDDPLPLVFDRTFLLGGVVDLEFRDGGLLLVSAFVKPDKPPSPKPAPVLLQMHDIRLEDVLVRLDFFNKWGLRVREVELDGEVGLRDRVVTVKARGITATIVEPRGDLPFPDSLGFLSRPLRGFHASLFHLHGRAFEVANASARGPRLDLRLSGTMDFTPGRPPSLESIAAIHVPDPTVLGEITGGAVIGALDAAVEAGGPLAAARLAVTVRSPRTEVLGVPFDDVDAAASMNLADPTMVRVLRLGCWFHAGRVDAKDVLVHALPGPGELVRIGGFACVEGADPAAAAFAFSGYDIRPLSPLLDGAMSGCVGARDLRVTDDDVTMDLDVNVAVGADVDPRTGLGAAWTAEGDLHLDVRGVETPGLEILAGPDLVSLEGGLRWDPELTFDLRTAGFVPGAARHLEAMGVADVGGDVSLHRLALRGTLDDPAVDLEVTVADLRTPALDLAEVELDASLEHGDLAVRRLAWADPLTEGALAGDMARLVGPGPRVMKSPWRVGVEAVAPIRLPLALLAPDDGVLGDLRLESLYLDGRVGTRAHHLLRDLRVAGEGVVTDLVSPAASARRAAMQFSAETRRRGGVGAPRIGGSLQIQGEDLDLVGVTMDAVEASATVQGIPLRFDWAALSMVSGDVTVEARGIEKGFLAFRDLAMNLHYPEAGDATFTGKVQVTRGVGARIEGEVAREDLKGRARLRFDRMPVRSVPLPGFVRKEMDPIREALVTGRVSLDWPALQPLLELPALKILPQLTMRGEIKAEHLETLPEPVREASASVKLKGGRVDLEEVVVTLASGCGIRGKARLDLDRMTGAGRVTWSPVDLRALQILADLDLPVQARIGGRLLFEGDLERPKVKGALRLHRVSAAGIRLGDAVLDYRGRIGDSIRITSTQFFDGFDLHEARIGFRGLEPVEVDAVLDFDDLTLARVLPGEELPVEVTATGAAQVHVDTRSRGNMVDASVHIEDRCLTVEIPALNRLLVAEDAEEAWGTGEDADPDAGQVFSAVNQGPLDLRATEQGAETKCLRLSTPLGPVSVSGEVDLRRGFSLSVGAALDLSRLAFLSPWLARLKGEVLVGARDACELLGDRFRLSGPITAPEAAGRISVAGVDLLARGYPREIKIRTGEMDVSGRLDTGDLTVLIPEETRVEAKHDEGAFSLWGEVDLAGWIPDDVELDATGSGIYFSVPRQYRLTMNPTVHLSLHRPFDEDNAEGLLKGRVDVVEGKYYRNFDRLLGSFATAFSRSQERYSRPITELIPFLRAVKLELEVRSTDFTVASRFPFGETDMEVDVDLKARGTLDDLELHDRLTLIPGGMITYKVVKREFEIQSGYADFTGNPGKPLVDVKAVTTINRIPTESGGYVSQSEKIWGRDVNITVHVYGAYPDLRFDLSSDSGEYDQADLQTLLLLGMTRKDLENQGMGEGSAVSINLITDDVARAVSNLLLSPFLDAVSLGFTREGGIQAETLTKVGRAMHLTTKVAQESDLQEYTAGFRFMLTDRLFLEGRMKMKQDSDETNQNYEGRLLYRIPLE